MASISKRTWVTPAGESKSAWKVDYKDGAGIRRSKQFPRKKDAEAWSTQASWQVVQGIHTADSQSITVGQACDLWLERAATENLEQSTQASYESRARLHIRPLIGDEKLSRLTRPQVEKFADSIVRTRGKATATMVMRALSAAIGEAMRLGSVAQNVAAGVRIKRPKRDRPKVTIPTKAELRLILNEADLSERCLVMVTVFTGLRGSELRGLRWADVDLAGARITVSQRADRYNAIGPPKSAAGQRSIPIPPSLVLEMKRWRLACPKGELDLVFPNGSGKVETHSNLLQRLLGPLQMRAGVSEPDGTFDENGVEQLTWRYGFHAFRHAAASLWIERRTNPKRVQTWLGHASIQLTFDTYGHLFEAAEADAAVATAIEAELFA